MKIIWLEGAALLPLQYTTFMWDLKGGLVFDANLSLKNTPDWPEVNWENWPFFDSANKILHWKFACTYGEITPLFDFLSWNLNILQFHIEVNIEDSVLYQLWRLVCQPSPQVTILWPWRHGAIWCRQAPYTRLHCNFISKINYLVFAVHWCFYWKSSV